MAMNTHDADYDRAEELKQFDESRAGVKGLVDSGLTAIPRIFIHPPETLSDLKPHSNSISTSIPIVDLSDRRSAIVDKISHAARELGIFQVTNHGIPSETLDRTIAAIKAFNDQPAEIRSRFYTRNFGSAVFYISNSDLYHSKAASWRDSLFMKLAPNRPAPEEVPEICRKEVVDWDKELERLGEKLMGLLSEGLGLSTDRLKEITCSEGRVMVGQYYPECPQPDQTLGHAAHSNTGVLTVLIQDQTDGGLQVKYGGVWVDVKPIHGAILISVGDLLQIFSNDEYKSVEHRVLANSSGKPRVHVSAFLSPSKREDLYGPLPELISPEKHPLFRQFTISEYMRRYLTKELDGKSLVNYHRV
ncbi:hypothetical protein FNV43_RR26869 [Rhamnella rubrinervis]|uniref:Fe2OG dioxygenase domain-containing protein n=1 Tax=Rhamnella rubrinervis TaxID=2594499 RepID=A0A8K0GRZ0_9ROSA|nr:hypothetical protein FNV43_RR26869 [Rhamnella rubrinervis]